MTLRNVFFDLDGTLHDGDMLASYVVHVALRTPIRTALLLPWLLVGWALNAAWPAEAWSLNCLLGPLTWRTSEARRARVDAEFVARFKRRLRVHPQVVARLEQHLAEGCTAFVASGSPESLIRAVYSEPVSRDDVHVIGSAMRRGPHVTCIADRCIGEGKRRMLEQRFGKGIRFEYGYTDSARDAPMLALCRRVFWVNRRGEVAPATLAP